MYFCNSSVDLTYNDCQVWCMNVHTCVSAIGVVHAVRPGTGVTNVAKQHAAVIWIAATIQLFHVEYHVLASLHG